LPFTFGKVGVSVGTLAAADSEHLFGSTELQAKSHGLLQG